MNDEIWKLKLPRFDDFIPLKKIMRRTRIQSVTDVHCGPSENNILTTVSEVLALAGKCN